jgi:hypothetical protein
LPRQLELARISKPNRTLLSDGPIENATTCKPKKTPQ